MFTDFTTNPGQIDLLDELARRANCDALMQVVNHLNHQGIKVCFVNQGLSKSWKMKRDMLSPTYTTKLKELSVAALK